MNNKINSPIKIISLLLTGLLLFAFNINTVFSASPLAPKPSKTPVPSKTPTPTRTPTSPPTGTPFTCTSWNIANDFRISPNQENPNRDSCNNIGVWEFMESASLTRDPATYSRITTFIPNTGGYTGLDFWYGTHIDGNGRFPAIGFNGSGANRVFGGITFPVNAVDIHPAPSQLGIIAWHSPLTGYVAITGGVSDNDPSCYDGISWYIDKNTTGLADGNIPNGGAQTYANGNNGAGLNTVAVNTGDIIYLAIDPYGNYGCDNTRVDLTISVTGPPTPTPNSNGSGTCWSSQESWAVYSVNYDIVTSPIPPNITVADWVASIEAAAQTWNNVAPSHFSFVRQIGNSNTVRYEIPNNQTNLAASAPPPSSGYITSGYTKINPLMSWDVNNTPLPNNPGNNGSTTTYNLQNVTTHEFGHWLFLNDITPASNPGCTQVTMDYDIGFGEIMKITLDIADENAINWQYP